MQDKDPFAYQFNKNQISEARLDESSLISLERSQKLDLLIHLISNLKQSLAICGPHGIGKTTLLDELKARKNDVWKIVAIQATGNLSFEGIQQQILQFLIKHYPEHQNQDLSSILSSLDKQSQKIVVLIDDAGQLVPGLISNVIQYAVASDCLRIVFSLTQDELHLKNSSDKSISDCHFIEIPPLTEKQCGVFLQNLSGKPDAIVSFDAISEPMVEKLYRQTHGIPGKILAELPKLSNYKKAGSYGWLAGAFFMAIAVAVGLKLFVFGASDGALETGKNKTALVLKNEKDTPAFTPSINSEELKLPAFEKIELKKLEPEAVEMGEDNALIKKINADQVQVAVLDKKQSAQKEVVKINKVEPVIKNIAVKDMPVVAIASGKDVKRVDLKEKQAVQGQGDKIKVKRVVTEKKGEPVEKSIKAEKNSDRQKLEAEKKKTEDEGLKVKKIKPKSVATDDGQWLLNQPKNNYSIQLMVLSKRKSVDEFLTKNKKLKQLKFFQLNKKSEKYAIIYGSFKSSANASKQMKALPAKYRKSWVRKIRALQKEIKK
jgi:DamX protein